MQAIKRFIREDEGAEVSEWALLVVVLGLAIVAGGPALKTALTSGLGNIGSGVEGAGSNYNAAATGSNMH